MCAYNRLGLHYHHHYYRHYLVPSLGLRAFLRNELSGVAKPLTAMHSVYFENTLNHGSLRSYFPCQIMDRVHACNGKMSVTHKINLKLRYKGKGFSM